LRFVLDENLPPPFARSLDALTGRDIHSVVHVREVVGSGISDVEWIAEISRGELSAIVSGDRRMLTRSHELQALRNAGLTTFILSAGWSNLVFWEKAWLLTRWWPTITALATTTKPGTIFQVPHKHRPTTIRSHQ
jgi:PIN domain-containing protein